MSLLIQLVRAYYSAQKSLLFSSIELTVFSSIELTVYQLRRSLLTITRKSMYDDELIDY
ncbi:hypothetical protein F383_27382 [Gossypium arboreum]|uniref:Uncharacterized protein n=1 Tax=Gossypium arboreum TaxID=29729 RepID=A0A0B0PAH5_GOSAR|nr:hypothetical protein F383_27382 [Gossypium arboreum]